MSSDRMVQAQSYRKQKEELRNFLRNSDIIPVATRGVTTTSDSFSGNNSTTNFTLTHVGVKNIRSIVIGVTTLVYGRDYNLTESETTFLTTITFTTAPILGTNNIVVSYDYGNGDKIYDDFPQDFITIKSFPRIGFDIISSKTAVLGLGADSFQIEKIVQISCFGIGKKQTEEYLDAIRQLILSNASNFYYWTLLVPDNIGPLLPVTQVEGNKVFSRNLDLRASFEFEL